MASIDADAFAGRLDAYLADERSFDRFAIDAALCSHPPFGIKFLHNLELTFLLLARAYRTATGDSGAPATREAFCRDVTQEMEAFAALFPEKELTVGYPHFLLHGIAHPTLDRVIEKIHTNIRIMGETRAWREEPGNLDYEERLGRDLLVGLREGCVDTTLGVYLLMTSTSFAHAFELFGYVAKIGFFTDTTDRTIYVSEFQGGRYEWLANDLAGGREARALAGKEEHDRITAMLGLGPRRYLLERLGALGQARGFGTIRILAPEEHPNAIENHEGFFANYGPLLRCAGFLRGDDGYLEKPLLPQHARQTINSVSAPGAFP